MQADFERGTKNTTKIFGEFARGFRSNINSLGENVRQFGSSVSQSLEGAFSNAIFDAITGKVVSLKQLFLGFANDVGRAFSKFAANELMAFLFGDDSRSRTGLFGGGVSAIQGLFGLKGKSIAGGSQTMNSEDDLKKKMQDTSRQFDDLGDNLDKFAGAKDRSIDKFNILNDVLGFGADLHFDTSVFVSDAWRKMTVAAGIGIGQFTSTLVQASQIIQQVATSLLSIASGKKRNPFARIFDPGNLISDVWDSDKPWYHRVNALFHGNQMSRFGEAVMTGDMDNIAEWAADTTEDAIRQFSLWKSFGGGSFGSRGGGGGSVTVSPGSVGGETSAGPVTSGDPSVTTGGGGIDGIGFGARGAIIRRPTMALIGEAGPEALVPLDKTRGNGELPRGIGGRATNVTISIDKAILNDPSDMDRFMRRLRTELGRT